MADTLHYYIVTASWPSEGCWECEGSTGQAFVYVLAHDGVEAAEMARIRLMPRDYGITRFVAATQLALPVSPQTRKARVVAEQEVKVRAKSYVTALKPERKSDRGIGNG